MAPDDGILDASWFLQAGLTGRLVQSLEMLASDGKRGLRRMGFSRGRLEAPFPLALQVDGEGFVAENPRVSVKPGALRILGPAKGEGSR